MLLISSSLPKDNSIKRSITRVICVSRMILISTPKLEHAIHSCQRCITCMLERRKAYVLTAWFFTSEIGSCRSCRTRLRTLSSVISSPRKLFESARTSFMRSLSAMNLNGSCLVLKGFKSDFDVHPLYKPEVLITRVHLHGQVRFGSNLKRRSSEQYLLEKTVH
jgi:hypothetical protein